MDTEIKRARRKKIASIGQRIKWGGLTRLLSGDGGRGALRAPYGIKRLVALGKLLEVLGISRGNSGGHKGDWWWNGEVEAKLEAKRTCEWVES
ncbi:hypothetical protein H5410_008886 [Solanum commersonii]|uniref:Uncharacterized protein n=1 Tax=Solanum commersonii TaxID=4109 RepID=A0A9J6AH72_SOLCO|nr:hypothetical protein H5410_008886 [Solanum commersonii]